MADWITQLGSNISVLSLAAVLILIAVRQAKSRSLAIWQIMLLGALAVLLTGQISPEDALLAINPDVMIFLAGMFVIGESMQRSGYLLALFSRLFTRARSLDQLMIIIIFSMGFLAALLMNDTLAIIGTPLMIYLARALKISAKLLLLTLAFAVTIGSVASPIGNPQNLLIAVNGDLSNPFWTFLQYLLLPTVINLLFAYLLLRVFYRGQFKAEGSSSSDNSSNNGGDSSNISNNRVNRGDNDYHGSRDNDKISGITSLVCGKQAVSDPRLARLSEISFLMLFLLILAKIAAVLLGQGEQFHLTYIAVISALPVLIFSERRLEIAKNIDWCTLIFFAAMFVLMESVWRSGLIQQLLASGQADLNSIPVILSFSVIVSQVISNVPFVALCQPLLGHPSAEALMALAAGSTIAGNLFILGAASNVIIIQNAERSGETITFLEFARVGVPLTALNALVYWLFL
jgi:Na+/H+ antiporter NhaD/arsenite permease-like protein